MKYKLVNAEGMIDVDAVQSTTLSALRFYFRSDVILLAGRHYLTFASEQ